VTIEAVLVDIKRHEITLSKPKAPITLDVGIITTNWVFRNSIDRTKARRNKKENKQTTTLHKSEVSTIQTNAKKQETCALEVLQSSIRSASADGYPMLTIKQPITVQLVLFASSKFCSSFAIIAIIWLLTFSPHQPHFRSKSTKCLKRWTLQAIKASSLGSPMEKVTPSPPTRCVCQNCHASLF
jgi:hypothetical protein